MKVELNLTSEKMPAAGSSLTSIRLRKALQSAIKTPIKHFSSLMSKSRPSATSIKTEATIATNSSGEVDVESKEV